MVLAGWRAGWAAARAQRAMLGGGSGAREREAEGDGAEAVPVPPAIEFPADGSDPKYDGERPGMLRRPSSCTHPPSLPSGQGCCEQPRASPQSWGEFGWTPAQRRGAAGGRHG